MPSIPIPESELEHFTAQSRLILSSYKYWTGFDLLPPRESDLDDAKQLFFVPFAVISATPDKDPILNYGNQTALRLWELNWEELVKMPGRHTAEPVERETREKFLKEVSEKGMINNYEGVRISKSGKRFAIKNATVWNLMDERGLNRGQAATFDEWKYLD